MEGLSDCFGFCVWIDGQRGRPLAVEYGFEDAASTKAAALEAARRASPRGTVCFQIGYKCGVQLWRLEPDGTAIPDSRCLYKT
jgi:hypothetical protein